jgi:hypothetical protein
MNKYTSPFEVDQLKPEGMGGKSGKTYQLTAASVSPVRITGRDELGFPVEETIPTVYYRLFVHPRGSVDKVPMRTASVFSMEPEAERYEQIIERDLVSAGWIPFEMCPYSTAYRHITGGPFVKPPADATDADLKCNGSPNGCAHMNRLIDVRKAFALKVHNAEHDRVYAMKHEDAQKMIEGISEGVGAALAKHIDVKARRNNLKEGKGEPDTAG